MNQEAQPVTRRWLPASMASRLYLIIFAGLMLAHGLSFGLLFMERYQSSTAVMFNTLEHDVGTSIAILDRLPAAERPAWLHRIERDNYHYILGNGQPGNPTLSSRARTVVQLIAKEVGPGYQVHAQTVSLKPERYQVHFTLHDGSPLTLEITPRMVPVASWLPFVFVLQIALLLLCTWFAVRLATRPLTRMAQAVEAMTPTADGPRMSQDGPTEVAHAAVAFNAMQDRIRRHLKERLHILASISHDLQTPITRMRLRAEALDESSEQEKILDDLRQMEHMVREGVAYARSAHGGSEAPVRIDAAAFLESMVFDYQDVGQPVTLTDNVGGTATVRAQALRRVLGNLIDNAIKYGGSAEVGMQRGTDEKLLITVSDRGPGIPDDELEQVLQPFYRLEASRNRDTGGTGLGLAIASQLMTSIGGSLQLSSRDGGGLVATIELP
ncbi:HAMP domain-containing sensor histidine kinase [Dyella sp. GSA-30]|uniref:sensor histidine kinase n=1 Tax=Dyella sp. GSA-30 TaxID=2994496 RepID=UPI002493195B|nr:HAMP domain-containing sensor histidine kinase [Dyella sp. GSA-30]BDU19081.1 two-component sensor histidine kinase [Dyella sp. GSA-30]